MRGRDAWCPALILVVLGMLPAVMPSLVASQDPFLDDPTGRLSQLNAYPCCYPDGTCTVTVPILCEAGGGQTYWWEAVCDPNPCPPASSNTLSLGSGGGLPGDHVTIPLSLSNEEPVKALQTDIIFDPEVVEYVSGYKTARVGTMAFSASVVGGDRLRVVMYYSDAGALPPGQGPIAELTFALAGPGGSHSMLTPVDTILSDGSGSGLPVTVIAGRIDVGGGGAPDLQVETLEFSPAVPAWDEEVSVRVRVANQGTEASSPCLALITLDGSVACQFSLPEIGPGMSVWTEPCELGILADGTHQCVACADVLNQVEEVREDNNCRADEVFVSDHILYIPDGVVMEAGQVRQIPVHLRNREEIKAFSVCLCLDGDLFDCQSITVNGTRAEGAELLQHNPGPCPTSGVIFSPSCPAIPPGDGPILLLSVATSSETPAEPSAVLFQDLPPALNRVTDCAGATMVPGLRAGLVDIRRADFVRGDVDASGVIDISDPVYNLAYQFAAGPVPPCLDAADDDDSGTVDISDVIRSLVYQFGGGPEMPPPFPDCGLDPTGEDPLDCASFGPCGTPEQRALPRLSPGSGREDVVLGTPRLLPSGLLSVPLDLATEVSLLAFQSTIRYNPQALRFLRLEPDRPWTEADFFSARELQEGGGIRLGCIPSFRLDDPVEPGRYRLGRLVFRLENPLGLADSDLQVDSSRLVDTEQKVIVLEGRPAPEPEDGDPSHSAGLTRLEWSLPNPYRPGAGILLRCHATGSPLTAEVFDVHGRKMQTLFTGPAAAPEIELSWDGRSAAGREAGSGMYYLRARAGGRSATAHLLLVR